MSVHVYSVYALQGLGVRGDLLGLIPGRQTFVFNAAGECVLSFNSQLNSEKHVEEAINALKAKP